jgi:hypothetical protein
VFERGSLGAHLIVVLAVTVGMAATTWYQGRLWGNGLRFWHGAALGLPLGVLVAFAALD